MNIATVSRHIITSVMMSIATVLQHIITISFGWGSTFLLKWIALSDASPLFCDDEHSYRVAAHHHSQLWLQ